MIICGNCKQLTDTVESVKACYEDKAFPCPWLIDYGRDEDGTPIILPCNAHATENERGYHCEAGHDHVNAETRYAEQWDYAEEYGEALRLFGAGVEPFTMSGHRVLGPQSFERL